MSRNSLHSLHQFVRLYWGQTAYYNTRGRRQQAEPDTLPTVLRLLGAPFTAYDKVDTALRLRRQALWQRAYTPDENVAPKPWRIFVPPSVWHSAAYWEGLDIAAGLDHGLLNPTDAQRECAERHQLRQALQRFLQQYGLLAATAIASLAVLSASLTYLNVSAARLVLVNLEELWLETTRRTFRVHTTNVRIGGRKRAVVWRRFGTCRRA
jgi:hypothetical protein